MVIRLSALYRASLVALAALSGCDSPKPSAGVDTLPPTADSSDSQPLFASDSLPPGVVQVGGQWTGDFDSIVGRRLVRILTVYGAPFYYVDGPAQQGVTYELARYFEDFINRGRSRAKRVHVILVPVARDQLFPALVAGYGDIAAAGLTITAARRAEVEFSLPLDDSVREVVVTGPSAPPIDSLNDLAGIAISVRRSSSYWGSLERINSQLRSRNRPPIALKAADERAEDGDLLSLVAAGTVPLAVADEWVADYWAAAWPKLTVRRDLVLADSGEVGWAFRKTNPKLRAVVDSFVRTHRLGTLSGNMLAKRYARATPHVLDVLDGEGWNRFRAARSAFQKYGAQYEFDWLLLAAQGFQESRLDPKARSSVGAVGIMQVRPATALEVGVRDYNTIDGSVRAGTKYLRRLADGIDSRSDVDPINRHLLALAAYNAGPGRLGQLQQEARAAGLDPDRWFGNVEAVAARRIGRETVDYVASIFKYYLAYRWADSGQDGRDE